VNACSKHLWSSPWPSGRNGCWCWIRRVDFLCDKLVV
jgi:hypothetical protein